MVMCPCSVLWLFPAPGLGISCPRLLCASACRPLCPLLRKQAELWGAVREQLGALSLQDFHLGDPFAVCMSGLLRTVLAMW